MSKEGIQLKTYISYLVPGIMSYSKCLLLKENILNHYGPCHGVAGRLLAVKDLLECHHALYNTQEIC